MIFFAINFCHLGLQKFAQMASNLPIWSHWLHTIKRTQRNSTRLDARGTRSVQPDCSIIFFNICAFTKLKNCAEAYKICQSKFQIFPNTKWTLSKWPKFFNIMPKWRNFAKSGHTELETAVGYNTKKFSSVVAVADFVQNCRPGPWREEKSVAQNWDISG